LIAILAFTLGSQHCSNRLGDTDARITGCEHDIINQLNRASSRLAVNVSQHMTSLQEYAATAFDNFQTNLMGFMETFLTKQRSKIAEMHNANLEKINHEITMAETAFALRLDQAIECAIQEILTTADEATENVNLQAEQIISQIKATPVPNVVLNTSHEAELKPSKLFPDVDVTAFNKTNRSVGRNVESLNTSHNIGIVDP
jgi:hypothetical protein